MNKYFLMPFLIVMLALNSCVIIKPGSVGVKQKLGKLSNEAQTQGAIWFNPFTTKVITASIQINDIKITATLPSKEGLSVVSQISILYKLNKNEIPKVISNIGLEYEGIISNVFQSASSDVCAQYYAKDMHSGMRAEIEEGIKTKMGETLTKQGIIIEAVLLKSIQLPLGLARSIEEKLQAEQDAMRMEFVLQIARQQAEKHIIEAKGISEAQIILSKGLTDQIIKIKSIEAFNALAKSPNSKIIVIDGKTPFLINE